MSFDIKDWNKLLLKHQSKLTAQFVSEETRKQGFRLLLLSGLLILLLSGIVTIDEANTLGIKFKLGKNKTTAFLITILSICIYLAIVYIIDFLYDFSEARRMVSEIRMERSELANELQKDLEQNTAGIKELISQLKNNYGFDHQKIGRIDLFMNDWYLLLLTIKNEFTFPAGTKFSFFQKQLPARVETITTAALKYRAHFKEFIDEVKEISALPLKHKEELESFKKEWDMLVLKRINLHSDDEISNITFIRYHRKFVFTMRVRLLMGWVPVALTLVAMIFAIKFTF